MRIGDFVIGGCYENSYIKVNERVDRLQTTAHRIVFIEKRLYHSATYLQSIKNRLNIKSRVGDKKTLQISLMSSGASYPEGDMNEGDGGMSYNPFR